MAQPSATPADLFRRRDFRRLLATRVLAQFGDGAFQVGLVGVLFFSPERETTPSGVAWALTATLLPFTVIGPFAGVLLDRWYRRQVLVVANLVRCALVAGLAVVIHSGTVGALLLLIALTCFCVDRFVLAGLGAALPHVVEHEQLVLANSLTPTLGTISTVTGAGTAFGVVQALGSGDEAAAAAPALAALAYLGSALAVTRIPRTRLGPDGGPERVRLLARVTDLMIGMVHGARHVWSRTPARRALLLTALSRLAFAVFTITTILLCRNTFTDNASDGIALIATVALLTGTGAGLAAVVVPVAVRLIGLRRWITLCLVLLGLIFATFAVAMSRTSFLVLVLPLGLAAQGVKVAVDTTLQRTVDEPYLGRTFSFYDMVFNASFVVAAILAVLIVPASGRATALFGAIAVALLVAAWPRLRLIP